MKPPSTRTVAPVRKVASGSTRNEIAPATSSVTAQRVHRPLDVCGRAGIRVHVGADGADLHGFDEDAPRSEVPGPPAGVCVHGGLRRRVIAESGERRPAGSRRTHRDDSTASTHHPHRGTRRGDDALHVGGELAIERIHIGVDRVDRPGQEHAGVVDEDVEPAERVHHRVDQARGLSRIGLVCDEGRAAHAELLDLLHHILRLLGGRLVADGDVSTLAGEPDSRGRACATGSTRNEGGLAGQCFLGHESSCSGRTSGHLWMSVRTSRQCRPSRGA